MIVDSITGTESGIFWDRKASNKSKTKLFLGKNNKSLLHNVDLCIFAVFEVEYFE